jgi:phosphoadenosine phosphosulfate reductase
MGTPQAAIMIPTTTLSESTARARAEIRSALDAYPGRLTLSCSFGGPSGMVLLDLALQEEPRLPIFVLDTGLLFPESYALLAETEARYGIRVDALAPLQTVAEQAATCGERLWERDPDRCCRLRKVEPLRRHLHAYDAWMTAVRRDQTSARSSLATREWDFENQVVKIVPLVDWSEDLVWAYVREHGLRVNALHDQGYPSVGCITCTRRVRSGESIRAGRWPGFIKTECGIHAPSASA